MKRSPEVCFRPKNNWLNFVDYPDYDPYTGSVLLLFGSHGWVVKYSFDRPV